MAFGRRELALPDSIRKPLRQFLEARRQKRTRMLAPAALVFNSCTRKVDCFIADASRMGARVRTSPGMAVPSQLYLVHLREWTAYDARVVWRRPDGSLGLSFKRSFDLEGAQGPDLRVMRELCAMHDARW